MTDVLYTVLSGGNNFHYHYDLYGLTNMTSTAQCDQMVLKVDCTKSHHSVISEGLLFGKP